MMNRYLKPFLAILCLVPIMAISQTNNLTGSPYSLFGLGVGTNSNIGKNSALGRGGYALEGRETINNYNPAAFAVVPEKNFMFDIGILAELSTVVNQNNEERRLAGNISSLAIASSITKNSGFGLTLDPYSDVGYAVIGIESNIEGSFDSFNSNIFGSGGLNDLKLSYGYQINEFLNVGVGLSYLFGNINETEQINAVTSFLTVDETNRYRGGRLDLGLQGKIHNKLAVGVRWQLPSALNAKRDRLVSKSIDFIPSPTIVENTANVDIPSFRLPLEVSSGIAFKPWEGLALNVDYTKNFWAATDQSDNVGQFVDQQLIALGAEYMKDATSYKYWERIQLRGGFNYDSGYLRINNETIDNFSITAGVGFPIGRSRLNISYAYRNGGASQGILVQETFHTVNINFSLRDLWFLKRKID